MHAWKWKGTQETFPAWHKTLIEKAHELLYLTYSQRTSGGKGLSEQMYLYNVCMLRLGGWQSDYLVHALPGLTLWFRTKFRIKTNF